MSEEQGGSKIRFAPVILAGGSGTRFWPRSRKARAKQVLALDGERTMIQQTLERLLPVADASDVWVITNDLLSDVICAQLPEVPCEQILSEPAARNTAPACALAAFLLEKSDPGAVIGMFPSDHVVKDGARFAEVVRAGIELAAKGETIVVLGVPPTRAETGYGYIELGAAIDSAGGVAGAKRVRRFTEKPQKEKAEEFVASGNYAWNSGIFLWSARTLANAIREYRPAMAPLLEKIAAAYGTADFGRVFAEVYPQCREHQRGLCGAGAAVARRAGCRGLSVCRGILGGTIWGRGRRCMSITWGGRSISADPCGNVVEAANDVVIEAKGNYVFAPGMAVALVGVEGLVVVQTEDALLITTRAQCQDVGKVVTKLQETGRE